MTQTPLPPWFATHPFICFHWNVQRMTPPTWTLLGECSSKIEHVSGTPLREDVADHFRRVYIAKGVHATTAIEGNTLSEAQVAQRIEGELPLPPSQAYLGKEIDNIVAAYNSVVDRLKSDLPFQVSPNDLRAFNKTVLAGLELEPDVVPGEFRKHVVGVHDYRAPTAEFVPELVQRLCDWLNHDDFNIPIGSRFVKPVLRAILSHLYIAWIHPFGDGNGRAARLVEFDILVRAGVPIVCAHLLSDHYNRTRHTYYRALSMARSDPTHFVEYAVAGLLDMLREQLSMIKAQQTEVAWVNFVHSFFHATDDSSQTRRRREVALALATLKEPPTADQIPTLTPKLAVMYANRTPRTLQRDLRALRSSRLVLPEPGGKVRANLDLIRAFLPHASAASSAA